MARAARKASRKDIGPRRTFTGQGKDIHTAFDEVAESLCEAHDTLSPREVLARSCIRGLVQLSAASTTWVNCEAAIILKTLAQRLMGHEWVLQYAQVVAQQMTDILKRAASQQGVLPVTPPPPSDVRKKRAKRIAQKKGK